MSAVLAYVILFAVVAGEALSIGYRCWHWQARPLPHRICGTVIEIAAVWLALRVLLGG